MNCGGDEPLLTPSSDRVARSRDEENTDHKRTTPTLRETDQGVECAATQLYTSGTRKPRDLTSSQKPNHALSRKEPRAHRIRIKKQQEERDKLTEARAALRVFTTGGRKQHSKSTTQIFSVETQRANHNAGHSAQALSSWDTRANTATENSQELVGFKFSINIQLGLDGSHSSNWPYPLQQHPSKRHALRRQKHGNNILPIKTSRKPVPTSLIAPKSDAGAARLLTKPQTTQLVPFKREDISRPRSTKREGTGSIANTPRLDKTAYQITPHECTSAHSLLPANPREDNRKKPKTFAPNFPHFHSM